MILPFPACKIGIRWMTTKYMRAKDGNHRLLICAIHNKLRQINIFAFLLRIFARLPSLTRMREKWWHISCTQFYGVLIYCSRHHVFVSNSITRTFYCGVAHTVYTNQMTHAYQHISRWKHMYMVMRSIPQCAHWSTCSNTLQSHYCSQEHKIPKKKSTTSMSHVLVKTR